MTSNGSWAICAVAFFLLGGCAAPRQAEAPGPVTPPSTEATAETDQAPVAGAPAGATQTAVTLDLPDLRTDELGRVLINEEEIGVRFYPGAQVVPGGSSRQDTVERKVLNVTLESYDPPSKVAEFYRNELQDARVSRLPVQAAEIHTVRGTTEDGAQIKVSATREGRKATVIGIKADIPKEPVEDPPPTDEPGKQG